MARQKTAEQRIAEVREDLLQRYLSQKGEEFEAYLQDAATDSESPIEQLMAMALVFAISCEGWFGTDHMKSYFNYGLPPRSWDELKAEPIVQPGIEIAAEVPIGPYRTDFLVRYAHWFGGYAFGAIECDGHDHHDLTKDQAVRDRARDRFFQDAGLLVLRYPGSEIWRNPLKCAADALGILERRAKEEGALRWKGTAD